MNFIIGLTVSIPRMSSLFDENDKEKVSFVASDIYNTLLTIMFPAVVGIIVLRDEIVVIISGNSYVGAVPSLIILSATMVLCLGAYFWGQAILVPVKKEGVCFKASLLSAAVCIFLNFFLIPIWKEKAAAFTTLIAEGVAFLVCRHEGVKYVKLTGTINTVLKSAIGCIGIIIISLLLIPLKNQIVLYTILTIIISVIVYIVTQVILKNDSILSVLNAIEHKYRKEMNK